MKLFFKNTSRGLFLFGMTLSFILSPIPRVNVVWADSSSSETGCYKEGDSDSERIYRPNCDMDNIVQKSRMSRYSESHGSFVAMMEQAVAGMMAVTLIQSLRFNYLHELQGELYGNDCQSNTFGEWTLRLAQLGALSYIIGDIDANTKFQRASKKATDVAFGTPTNSEEFKATKNEQLRSFDTLIKVMEAQESGLKTKQALSIVTQAAFLASLSLEGIGVLKCNAACGVNKGLQKARLTTLTTTMTVAEAIVTPLAASVYYSAACAPAVAGLKALQVAVGKNKALDMSTDSAESKSDLVKKKTKAAFWTGVLSKMKTLFLGKAAPGADVAANSLSEAQLNQIENILKVDVAFKEDAEAAAKSGVKMGRLTGDFSTDMAMFSSVVGTTMACQGANVAVASALNAFVDYFYSPVECCGGPGMNQALQTQLETARASLIQTATALSPQGQATNLAKEAAQVAKKELQKKLVAEFTKKGVSEAVSALGAPKDIVETLMSDSSNSTVSFANGTVPGLGLPTVSQFASTKDIRVKGLLEGLFSSTEELESFKRYAKNNFESMLRRLSMRVQLSRLDIEEPNESLKVISELEQKINNILFFFDQVVEQTPAQQLARGEFKKSEQWEVVMNMISDMVFPKAHALGMLGNMAAGMGLKMVQKAVGTKGPWDEILGLGSQYMLVNSLIGKFAKSHGFTSPKGRMYTWGAMNIVNGAVLVVDQKAKKDVEDAIEVLKAERERYANAVGYGGVSDGEGGDGNGDDATGKLVANSGDSSGREVINGEANIRRCATANGQGFLPAPCPMKATGSTFDPPKISTDYASSLTPDHLSTMKNISNISRGLATGSMGADDLASMDLDSWQSANNAMRAFNEKLIKKIDAADKKRFKDSDVKPTPLQEMLNDAKKAFSGGTSAPALASLSPSKSKLNTKGESTKDKNKEKTGFTKTNPYGKGGSVGSTTSKDEFDFGLSEGGIDTEKREVAVNAEKSLDDFVINHDDINKRKDVSIFKILSNRYLLSYPKVLEEK